MMTGVFYKSVLLATCLTVMVLPCNSYAQAQQSSSQAASLQNDTSLTDFIDQNQDKSEVEDSTSKNWLEYHSDKVAKKVTEMLATKDTAPIATRRSNASVFDIAGIMLRMDLQQASEAMQKRGYKKTSEHWEIPNFIRWRYEEQCRNQGIIGFERIDNCVVLLAKQNNYQYIQKINFNNFHTKESTEVYFTSNFTGNKVYRIIYQTEAANIKGSGAKSVYLRNIKIFDFWKKVNQKYGRPDNQEEITWGLGDKKPSLKATTGRLILEDPMLLELDYTRMSREDQKFMNTAVYSF